MSSELVHSAAERIMVAFDLGDDVDVPSDITMDQVRGMLVNVLIHLLNSNPEKMMSILYRIDVSEARVNEIFTKSAPPDFATELADLIIERQLKKAESRKRNAL